MVHALVTTARLLLFRISATVTAQDIAAKTIQTFLTFVFVCDSLNTEANQLEQPFKKIKAKVSAYLFPVRRAPP